MRKPFWHVPHCQDTDRDELTKGLVQEQSGNWQAGGRRIKDKIKEALIDSDMVFLTCGEGGGTGTGASPIIAEVARELEALTVAVVTKPFAFEGLEEWCLLKKAF